MSKSLRTASVAASVLLHLALVSSLILNPPKFELPQKDAANIIGVRSELALVDTQSEQVIPRASRHFTPVKLKTSTYTPPPMPGKTQLEHGETKQTETAKSDKKPEVRLLYPNAALSVIDSVNQILAISTNAKPTDFAMVDGQFVRQYPNNEVTAQILLPLVDATNEHLQCGTTEEIQRALQSDPAILMSLASIPRNHRSVANVIMAWDGMWIDTQSPIEAVRAASNAIEVLSSFQVRIQQLVRSLSAPCAIEINHGPTFIVINTESEPTILAFGSREWRWGDLLLPTEPVPNAWVEAFRLSSRPDFLNR
jgi:hypothetical protein